MYKSLYLQYALDKLAYGSGTTISMSEAATNDPIQAEMNKKVKDQIDIKNANDDYDLKSRQEQLMARLENAAAEHADVKRNKDLLDLKAAVAVLTGVPGIDKIAWFSDPAEEARKKTIKNEKDAAKKLHKKGESVTGVKLQDSLFGAGLGGLAGLSLGYAYGGTDGALKGSLLGAGLGGTLGYNARYRHVDDDSLK